MYFELLLFWTGAWGAILRAMLRAILRAWPPLACQGGLAVPLFCNKNRFFNKNTVLTSLKPTANIPAGFRFTFFSLCTTKSLPWKFARAWLWMPWSPGQGPNPLNSPRWAWWAAPLTSCPFLQCSVSCGRGVQRRSVQCHSGTPKAAEEAECDPASRPPPQRDCHLPECPTHRWAAGEWQAVSGDPPSAGPVLSAVGWCGMPRGSAAGGSGCSGCDPGLPKGGKKKKKKEAEGRLVHAGWKGERRNASVGIIYCFVLPCVWLGPMQILSRFWVGRIWVSSRRQSPGALPQPEPRAWRN